MKRHKIIGISIFGLLGIFLGISLYTLFGAKNTFASSFRINSTNTLNDITYFDDGWIGTDTPEETEQVMAEIWAAEGVRDLRPGHNGNPPAANTSTAKPETPAPQPAPKKTCDHVYEVTITKEATCAEEGSMTHKCSKCGDTYTEVISKTSDHKYVETVTKDPSCTEEGELTYTCSVCGDTYTSPIKATGHDYEEKVTKEPLCEEAGEKTFTCKNCKDSYTEEIPPLGHDESKERIVDKEASWFFEGARHSECTRCQKVMTQEIIPSKYPTYYLYIGAGIIGALIIATVIILVLKKKRRI